MTDLRENAVTRISAHQEAKKKMENSSLKEEKTLENSSAKAAVGVEERKGSENSSFKRDEKKIENLDNSSVGVAVAAWKNKQKSSAQTPVLTKIVQKVF